MRVRFKVFGGFAAAAALAAGAPAAAKSRYAAEVVRTTYGIPHIRASDHGGLGYGVGYTAAEDNLCVIAEQVMTVRGERSRYLGAGEATVGFQQIANLDSDIYHRVIGDIAALRKAAAAAPADYRALIAGYAAGYNRFVRDRAGRLARPCGDQGWVGAVTADDVLLMLNATVLETGLSGFAGQIANAAPAAAEQRKAAGVPRLAPASVGSNGWAFGAQATANGRGIVVGNPHFPWDGPNRFRQMHLTIPGKLDVMGAGLVVTPFVAIGFNKDVAWTHTVSTTQHFTLFALELDPADPTAYRVDGRAEKMTRRAITVPVKDGSPVTRTLYATRYGPLVAMPRAGLGWTATTAYAVRDANLFNQRAGETWMRLARARSVREVRAAIGQSLGAPYVNTIAADRGGEALYADVTPAPNVSALKLAACGAAAGKAPALVAQRIFVLDGSRARCDWDRAAGTPVAGLMSEAMLPTLFRRDFVQNSNDSYWLTNPAQPLPAASPLIGPTGTRINLRTQSGLTEIGRRLDGSDGMPGRKVDHQSAKAMILANRSLAAERMLPDLLALCGADAALAAPCAALRGWDRRADIGSRGALLFFSFVRKLGGVPGAWTIPFDPADPVASPRGLVTAGPAADGIRKALAEAAAELTALKVPLDAPLGAVQVAIRGGERIPIHGGPGSAGILNVMASRPVAGALVPVHGTSYVQVVSFDERGPVADAMLSYSQSTDPASPHFADGTRAYSAKRWNRLPFTPADIARARIAAPLRLAE